MSLDLFLTEDQQAIQQLAKDFAQSVVKPAARDIEKSKTALLEVWQKLADLGLAGLPFTETYGGGGADSLSYLLAVEEIAKVSPSLAVTLSVHTTVGILPIYQFGSDALKQQFLPDLLSGKKIAAFALTEADAGSDAASGHSKATWQESTQTWLLSGGKIFTTNANIASVMVLTAITEEGTQADSHKRMSAFVLDKTSNSAGLTLLPGDEKMGIQGSDWANCAFDGVTLPSNQLIGTRGQGFKIFMHCLNDGRISIGAMATGTALGAFELAKRYSQERKQFDKPLADFQATQFKLANMATQIAAARGLVFQANALKQAGVPYTAEAAMAKLYASEMAVAITNDALQIFGGYGYTKDFDIERLWRDARCLPIVEGTSEIQRLVIAKHLR